MNPVLLDLGIIKIYWYSICVFLGILLGGLVIMKETKKFNIEEDFIINFFFWAIIISVLGARLYYVAFNWDLYSDDLISILKVWEGGLAIHGGIIAGSLFTIIYCKKYKVSPALIMDFIVVGLLLGQAIGRWGNFFNGECHGAVTSLKTLKMLLTPDFIIKGMSINGNYYFPTFLYESIWCFIGFILLLFLRRRKYNKIGQTLSLYLIWYGVGRFFIEFLRTDSLMLGNFKAAQLVSIVMVLLGILLFFIFGRGSKFKKLYNQTEASQINF